MSSSDQQVFRAGTAPKVARGTSAADPVATEKIATAKLATKSATAQPSSAQHSGQPSGAQAGYPAGQPAAGYQAAGHPGATNGNATGPTAYDRAAEAIDAPRTVRLTLARIDPLSMMKLSFLLSVALGIAMVVATVVIWQLLNAMGVFGALADTLGDVASGSTFNIYDYVGLGRVVSLATFIAVINVVLMMALATIGAVLYNVASSLVGGLHVTLSDD